jgi:hypothetical protein
MTLDKHQIDGIGGFSERVLPANQFEELMTNAGYSTSTAGFPLHSGTPLGGGRNASERARRFRGKLPPKSSLGIAPPSDLTSCALSRGGGV